jgi:hypothetical protein
MNARFVFAVSLLAGSLASTAAQATELPIVVGATIAKISTTSNGLYGGCMIRVDSTPGVFQALGGTCPAGWVAFSCDGTYTSKDLALMMLDQAQLAFALGKTVNVAVDDAKKHNGYCTGIRLDIVK